MSVEFAGVYANLPTAYDDSGEDLSAERQRAIVEYVLDRGVHGVACLLSSGEFPYLSHIERSKVIQTIVEQVNGRVPVLAGVSAFTTGETISLAKQAREIGASVAMILPMRYIGLTDAEVIAHFAKVADAVDIPLGLYENVVFRKMPENAELYVQLAEKANLKVSKHGNEDVFHISVVNHATRGSVSILDGSDANPMAALAVGAAGLCTSFASVWPQECVAMYDAMESGDLRAAQDIYFRLVPALHFYREHILAKCVKATAKMKGFPAGPLRHPVIGLDSVDVERLRKINDELANASVTYSRK